MVRRVRPEAKIAWGGGYPSTELRELKEPRVFDYVDYVVLDDGDPLIVVGHPCCGLPDKPVVRFAAEGSVVDSDEVADSVKQLVRLDYSLLMPDDADLQVMPVLAVNMSKSAG